MPAALATPAFAAGPTTYDGPGTYSYTVPAGTTSLLFTVAGAPGTDGVDLGGATAQGRGGAGGVVTGSITVTPGWTLTVDVGGHGTGYYPGGWAGYGGRGGDASDIRGFAIAAGGGGGGMGNTPCGAGGNGGAGGYPSGLAGIPSVSTDYPGSCDPWTAATPGAGGTQTAGGSGGFPYGGDGGSGFGGSGIGGAGGGGGGGGYFGGGDGGDGAYRGSAGGGGGSSWASSAVQTPEFCTGCSALASVTLTPLSGSAPTAGNPSSTCEISGGQQVVDNAVEGVATSLYVLQRPTAETDVCLRVQDANTGVGYGGMAAITPTVPGVTVGGSGAGEPSVDNNGSACSTTTPNAVPGSHPMASGGVAGQSYAFDTYSNGSNVAWVCLQVGSSVNDRVIVPISVSVPSIGITPGTDVTFYPDPGTP